MKTKLLAIGIALLILPCAALAWSGDTWGYITRATIQSNADLMIDSTWVPKNTFTNFEYGSTYLTYTKGVTYTGVAYSQNNPQENWSEFSNDVTNTSGGSVGYGNDCSGFVSICWKLPAREVTSTFESELGTYWISLGDIGSAATAPLLVGDALNSSSVGHIVMFLDYESGGIRTMEQTPNNAQRKVRSYSDLAEYRPIRRLADQRRRAHAFGGRALPGRGCGQRGEFERFGQWLNPDGLPMVLQRQQRLGRDNKPVDLQRRPIDQRRQLRLCGHKCPRQCDQRRDVADGLSAADDGFPGHLRYQHSGQLAAQQEFNRHTGDLQLRLLGVGDTGRAAFHGRDDARTAHGGEPDVGSGGGGVAVPANQSFAGDYRLRFDMWINVNGPLPGGGTSSTESLTAGIGTAGNRVQWTGTGSTADGYWFAADGDGGVTDTSTTFGDYCAFVGTSLQAAATGVYTAGTDSTAQRQR